MAFYYYTKYNSDLKYNDDASWTLVGSYYNSNTNADYCSSACSYYSFNNSNNTYTYYKSSQELFASWHGTKIGDTLYLYSSDMPVYSTYPYKFLINGQWQTQVTSSDLYKYVVTGVSTGVSYSTYKRNSSSNSTYYAQGSYITSLTASDGTYPDNGRHTDGYWYIKGAIYDITAPTIAVSDVVNGSVYNTSVTPIFSAIDNESGVKSVTATLDGVSFLSGTRININGTKTLIVTAVDNANNSINTTISFTVDINAETIASADIGIYIDALRSSIRKQRYRIEICDSNENTIADVTDYLIDGSISIELKNGVRRTCNITFDNSTGVFIPTDSYSLIAINNRIKIYSGLEINGEDVMNLRGVFVLGNPRLTSKFAEGIAVVEGYDKFALLDDTLAGQLETQYIIPISTSISNAVTDIFFKAGIHATPVIYPTAEVTPYILSLKPGDTYAKLLYNLADMLSWNIYFDASGNGRFEPPVDETTQAESWEFSTDEVSYLGSVRNMDWNNVRNNVKVIGDSVNGTTVTSTASDTYLFSETNIDRIGKRTKLIEDELIKTQTLADERSAYELKKAIQVQETIDLTCIPIDILDEGNVVLLSDTKNGIERQRYLIRNITYPLDNGQEMSMKIWKVREVI